jgi:hypothetical protein
MTTISAIPYPKTPDAVKVSAMEIPKEVIIGGLSVLFGSGGVAGLWAYITKRGGDESAVLRLWYSELADRVKSLETIARTQQETIMHLSAENAELKAEKKIWAAEREVHAAHVTAQDAKIDRLRQRIDDMSTGVGISLAEISDLISE